MPGKILVIDDEPNLREMLSDILSNEGFTVVTASNGEEGLKKIYEESPDLIVLDCAMPILDGYELLERMRTDPMLLNKPVVMLTVQNNEHDEIRGLRLGVDDYITKPFKPSLLVARINSVLERKMQSISANPLSFLPGNAAIKAEAEKRIVNSIPFAMIYLDIANFKSFNDRYGFQRGDEIIKNTASILIRSVQTYGQKGDFIGHIGGDDFIIISTPSNFIGIAEEIIRLFDESIPKFYDKEDRERGYIVSKDRSGNTKNFPFMTIQLAIISNEQTRIAHYGELSEIASELKKIAKQSERSTYVLDRRKRK
ncbi:MAG: response regulator [Elusimicrobia bacterium]|nr:response regulator [Candidatus Liberimonas magnetica]